MFNGYSYEFLEYDPVSLHDAAERGDRNAITKLLEIGFKVNDTSIDNITPLHKACLHGNADCAELLIKYGAEVDAYTTDGSTPLCEACASGNEDCVKLLLGNGAQVNLPFLMTPLHEAALKGNTKCIQLLIDSGARLNDSDCHYGTPLHAAAFMNRVPAARLLLLAGEFPLNFFGHCLGIYRKGCFSGAKVNAIKFHQTALHVAASNNCYEMSEVLLEFGADVFATDNQGKRARELLQQTSGTLFDLILSHERNARSLQDLCRMTLRRTSDVSKLMQRAPKRLKAYLLHQGSS